MIDFCWLGTIIELGLCGGGGLVVAVEKGGAGVTIAELGGLVPRRLLLEIPALGLRRTVRADNGGLDIMGCSSGEDAIAPADRRVVLIARGLFPLEGTVKIPATLPLRCSFERAPLRTGGA